MNSVMQWQPKHYFGFRAVGKSRHRFDLDEGEKKKKKKKANINLASA